MITLPYLEIVVDVLSLYKTPNKHVCSVLFKCAALGKTKFIKFPPSQAAKDVKCPGYAPGEGGGGMFKP